MKQLKLAELILLSLFLLLNVPIVSNVPILSKDNADLRIAYPVPEGIQNATYIPTIPEDFNDTYLNTTNTYSDMISPMSAFDEVDDIEGHQPFYALVAGDEEERQIWRGLGDCWLDWKGWATLQIERGDEALVANFGIDIRILGFIEWDSDDSARTMADLWYDLESKTSQYLRTIYSGNGWTNYVDAIIGISAQATPDEPNIPGISSGPEYLDQGRVFSVLKWQVYWMDDNIVQHEVSHLFYADDHYVPNHTTYGECCVMEGDTHSISFIWEDGLWSVFNDIPCAYITYSWCNQSPNGYYPFQCLSFIDQHKSRYQSDLPVFLGWWDPYQTKPVTIYYWYDEENDRIWQEVKSGSTSSTIR
jgi:hypothetical protein